MRYVEWNAHALCVMCLLFFGDFDELTSSFVERVAQRDVSIFMTFLFVGLMIHHD